LSEVDERGALEAVERILNRGGESRSVIEEALEALRRRGVAYAAVRFADGGALASGTPSAVVSAPIVAGDSDVASLEVAGAGRAFVERIATLISPYVRTAARPEP
jgi:hypothetical protein